MARIETVLGLDLDRINLNWPIANQYRIESFNDWNITIEGRSYRDAVEVLSYGGGNYFSTFFLGQSITYSAGQGMTGGTVTGFGEAYWTGFGWETYMMFTGLQMSARDLWRAAQTPSNKDDLALLEKAFSGKDEFRLSNYDDTASAHAGDDRMLGYDGDDSLSGGTGRDSLSGGLGEDRLVGGQGKDQLRGGSDADVFAFTTMKDSDIAAPRADVIIDFDAGEDRIGLKKIDAFAKTKTNDTFVWKGTDGFSLKTKGEVGYKVFDRAGTSSDHTMVYVDNDGDSKAEMAIRLTGLHDLSASDFLL